MECRAVIKPIRVGYRQYSIQPWTQAELTTTQSHGQCDKMRGVIYVCTEDDPLVVVDTLIHELLHAIWHEYGLDEKEDEERAVLMLATGLTQVLADNPHLCRWINRQIRAGVSD